MPGTITHLAVAKKILDILPKGTIKNKALFYAGSIAPDAIHSKVNYVREDKKRTHMRTKISDANFHETDNLNIFRNRVSDFINTFIDHSAEDVDLYKGYIVHLFTDEIFVLTIRYEFARKMNDLGISQSDKLFHTNMIYDLNNNDIKLVKLHPDMKEITSVLENLDLYEIKGYLTEEQLLISRNWVLRNKLKSDDGYYDAKYISYESILDFIEESSKEIISRLLHDKVFNY